MRTPLTTGRSYSRRRGVVLIYICAALTVMLAFCSLAVDLGRVQTAKTEIRRACDAAARAAAAYAPQGIGQVQSAAVAMGGKNKVDTAYLTINPGDVALGIWNKQTQTFSQSGSPDYVNTFLAVQVIGRRTKANGNPIPLMFGALVGANTCDVSATSVAALVAVQAPQHIYVSAHGNPWLAGEPKGTLGSVPDTGYDKPSANDTHPWKYDIANPAAVATADDEAGTDGNYTAPTNSTKIESTDYSAGEPDGSPAAFNLTVTPGSVIQVSIPDDSSNLATNHGYLTNDPVTYSADGSDNGTYAVYSDDAANPTLPQGTVTTDGSEHGISNIATPINSVVGVFLNTTGGAVPDDQGTVPAGVDFSTANSRDYTTYDPDLRQTFYVGSGQNSQGVAQTIVVPANATTLFLGTMDGHEWSNNEGGYQATITQYQIELVH
jgi:Flp pilus assembly protein TadG